MSPTKTVIETIGKVYAGRASASPIVDLFITLLSMGLSGYKRILEKRAQQLPAFSQRLDDVAKRHGERLLICPRNDISFGITLDFLARPIQVEEETEQSYLEDIKTEVSRFGAMLFSRCVSGTRVVPRGESKSMGGEQFVGFGSSHSNYPHAYMTAACAVGVSDDEIEEFFARLDKTFTEFKKRK